MLILGGYFGGWFAVTPGGTVTPTVTPPTTADFSVTVIDGITGTERNLTAWGLFNCTDEEVNSTFTFMKSGTAEELLTKAAIDEVIDWSDGTEESYWLQATAANNVSLPHDNCAYLATWVELNLYGANVLAFYATPSANIATLLYQNGTSFTTANYTAATSYQEPVGTSNGWSYAVGNFSAVVGINASDVGSCGYHGIFDLSAAEGHAMTGVYLVFNFNATVVNADLTLLSQIGGTATWAQVTKLNNTALAFHTANLYDTYLLNFQWKSNVADTIKCISTELVYGTWGEAAAHSGTSLKVAV